MCGICSVFFMLDVGGVFEVVSDVGIVISVSVSVSDSSNFSVSCLLFLFLC